MIDLIIPFFLAFNPYENFRHYKWYLLVLLAHLMLCKELTKKSHISLGIFFGYCGVYTILIGLFKVGIYQKASLSLLREVMYSYIFLNALILVYLYAPHKKIINTFKYLSTIAASYTLLASGLSLQCNGFGCNPSPNGTLLSLLLPFNLHPLNILLNFVAIFSTNTSMGLVSASGAVAVYYFFKLPNKKVILPTILLFLTGVGTVGFYRYGAKLWQFTGRLDVWEFMYKLWTNQFFWLGTGNGSFSHMMPALNGVKEFVPATKEGFMEAHNDILQLALETGIVGLALGLWVYYEVVRRCWRYPWMMAYIAAWTINSLGNFPNHLADQSFLTILFLTRVYKLDKFRRTP